jgi:hypothetical protein
MKAIKMLSTACVVVSAFAALSTTAASAHEWKLHGSPLLTSKAFYESGKISFEDTTVGAELGCSVVEEGTVGAGAAGKITKITSPSGANLVSCESARFCRQPASIEALHLPWSAELVELEGELRNVITTKGAEWKIQCFALGENWVNDCGVSLNMGVKNVTKGVEEFYDGKSARTSCSAWGAGSLISMGSGLIQTQLLEPFSVI